MKCIGCGSDDAIVALIEIFPCKYCNKEMRIEYNTCRGCGVSWKSLDGEFFSDTTIFDVGLGDLFAEDADSSFNVLMKNIEDGGAYMGDYIHRCLKCNTVCHEAEEDTYECPECGFRWEVISG